jgi:sulfate permease, SulP family
VFFFGAVPNIDLAGAELLADLHRTLKARAIDFRLANVYGEVRDALRRTGFEREHGTIESSETIDMVIARWHGGMSNRRVTPSLDAIAD